MIRYSLTCDRDHSFESWFKSADAFDRLLAAGHVACLTCGSTRVTKDLMAPAVRPARQAETRPLATPQGEMEQALAAMRRQVEENSEYVGLNFASEARRIHEGEAPGRSIYGEARIDEAKKLLEDGVPVATLPFMPARKTN
ncbi:DUF1178 family protein [Albidovulum sediminicola]|uniref:DUF1178 family protein n=1 Tax=Albidovulum sediminicola TaxID=2984331 RepID=A0ABT2Z335_9RHOB|nr:DUF1178 family protein [Defluviimonas sp. WL0075]MCV2865560.1 DUF1178 family protein [Defluviimonas sp. WL0075]